MNKNYNFYFACLIILVSGCASSPGRFSSCGSGEWQYIRNIAVSNTLDEETRAIASFENNKNAKKELDYQVVIKEASNGRNIDINDWEKLGDTPVIVDIIYLDCKAQWRPLDTNNIGALVRD